MIKLDWFSPWGWSSIPGVSNLLRIRGDDPNSAVGHRLVPSEKLVTWIALDRDLPVILSWRIWDVRRSLWDLVRSFWTVHIHHIFHHMLSYFIYSRMDYTSLFTHTAVSSCRSRTSHSSEKCQAPRQEFMALGNLGFYQEWILHTSSYPFLTQKN